MVLDVSRKGAAEGERLFSISKKNAVLFMAQDYINASSYDICRINCEIMKMLTDQAMRGH